MVQRREGTFPEIEDGSDDRESDREEWSSTWEESDKVVKVSEWNER